MPHPPAARFMGAGKGCPTATAARRGRAGGTLYAATPGGTRIIYDLKFLLECKNSPTARRPPCCLPQIPGVTAPPTAPPPKLEELTEQKETEEEIPDDEQFGMDI
ncbi:eukaryotic translation initiation factor 4E-binding protein 3 [Bos taurus]|nr:eukaryotic translation initiation factor 4E-binding protein 3 [Bos taurus]XP_019820609.1 PREDICTED: eukaryotic translation initiation factor 4E-binding protein 3 [Bos indicus]